MGRSGTRADNSDPPRDQPDRETRQNRDRAAKRKGKEPASSSAQPDAPEVQPRGPTYPWPREDDEPFTDPVWKLPGVPHMKMKDVEQTPMYRNRLRDPTRWGRCQCLFYNGLHRVDMTPTRFICPHTLRKMGIEEDVRQTLQRMGLGTMPYKTYPLYPEVGRQLLASAELLFQDAAFPRASEATLSFFSSGKLYEISIRDICRIYGFDDRPEECRFITEFDQVTQLWNLIGPGRYESRSAKVTHIRNPVIRVVAKILGSTLFGKEETGSVRKDELQLIHFGLPEFISEIYSREPPSWQSANLGAIFAEILVQKKSRGLNTVNRKWEVIGSLLTPIFIHCRIDLSSTPQEPKIALLDEQFFMFFFFQAEDGIRDLYVIGVQTCALPI